MNRNVMWLAVLWSVMNTSGCLSVVAAALIPQVGTAPLAMSMTVFSAAFTGVIALGAKWYLDKRTGVGR